MALRVFKLKRFAKFARDERLSDAGLVEAIQRAERGLVDADLGGGLIKQRVARQDGGRSGGYRMIIGYRVKDRAVFLFGFAKSERANIDVEELASWRAGETWRQLFFLQLIVRLTASSETGILLR